VHSVTTPDEYKLQLEVFEGPLDLLLYLIKKEELDIYQIPIERITSQYMEYLGLMKMLDLDIAGEFIVMAATLLMIKSRMLLPVEDRPELEAEEEYPRWDLVRQLLEYKKFKDVALRLQERESWQENVFPIGAGEVALEPEDPGLVLQDVGLFDLITAFRSVLQRARPETFGEIEGHRFTVADKIDAILNVMKTGQPVSFFSLFVADASRHEIICTFLALLELIRLRQVSVAQDRHFGDILIHPVTETPSVALAEAPAADGEPSLMENPS